MKSLLFILLLSSPVFGQISIIPQPAVIQAQRGEFVVRPGLLVWASAACSGEKTFLQTYWQEAGLPALSSAPKAKKADVVLLVDASRQEALGPEGYELIVSPKRISIAGATATGVFYGLQTLRQVLSGAVAMSVQAIQIRDKPRFGWRSFRLNETRDAVGMAALKTLLNELALLKFNRFHWQSTELSGRPYTTEQIREIVRYAGERHITMVPETEVQSKTVPRSQPLSAKTIIHFREGDPQKILDAANLGHNLVISTRTETTLSNPITDLSLDRVYRFEPIPDQMPEDLRPQILGVAYEYQNEKSPSPFSQLHPRLAAAAEVAWTFSQNKDFARFKAGLTGLYNGPMLR